MLSTVQAHPAKADSLGVARRAIPTLVTTAADTSVPDHPNLPASHVPSAQSRRSLGARGAGAAAGDPPVASAAADGAAGQPAVPGQSAPSPPAQPALARARAACRATGAAGGCWRCCWRGHTGDRIPPPTPQRWALLDPTAAVSGDAAARLQQLRDEGYTVHRLTPGFPLGGLPCLLPQPPTDLWSLLREADAALPAGSTLAVFTPGRLTALRGTRPCA